MASWGWVCRADVAHPGGKVALMSGMLLSVEAPCEVYAAADWLRSRHPWVDQLVRRIVGAGDDDSGQGWAGGDWLDELAGAVNDGADHAAAWREYAARHRAPDGERAYVAWVDAGPAISVRGAAFAVMSGGEQRLVRLVATLCPSTRVAWSVSDVGFDERGAAVLRDWLQIVHAQLLDESYPPPTGGGV
jgi:hypothetical protein